MLVRVLVTQHRRHVLAALVGESAVSDEGLLQRQRQVGDLGHRARELAELCDRRRRQRFEAVLEGEVRHDRHEVGVAASLAVTVDRALDHVRARRHARECVGHRELAVVVRVDADPSMTPRFGQRLAHGLHAIPDCVRCAASVRIA